MVSEERWKKEAEFCPGIKLGCEPNRTAKDIEDLLL